MIINRCSQLLFDKSPALFHNYQDNCIVVREMLKKYKKEFPNISDYSIMHFIDIAEFCDLLINKQVLGTLNEDECYCLLVAALFAHTGFGLNQDEMNLYVKNLGLEGQTEGLTGVQIMKKYHILFSVCLLEKYGDIFEFPSETHRYAMIQMLKFMGKNSLDGEWIEEFLSLDNGHEIRLRYLSAVLAMANNLSELKNSNLDLAYEDFDQYDSDEIVGFVERNAVRAIRMEGRTLVVEARGSDAVYALIERKIDFIREIVHGIISSLSARSENREALLTIDTIELRRDILFEEKEEIYINKEIEETWSEEDLQLFGKLSLEEKSFYVDYLSAEFGMTKFLVDFAKENGAVLSGLEYRVKSPKSLYNKLHQRKEKESVDTVADVIRYTVILKPDCYVEDINKIVDSLANAGWKIYSRKNYWTVKDLPYNGVNAKFKNKYNYRAEIQFHTQESFDVKMGEEDHRLYEERRILEPGSDEYQRILQLQLQLYSKMEVPRHIELLGNIM